MISGLLLPLAAQAQDAAKPAPSAIRGAVSIIQKDRAGAGLLQQLEAMTGKPALDSLLEIVRFCRSGEVDAATEAAVVWEERSRLTALRKEKETRELRSEEDVEWVRENYPSELGRVLGRTGGDASRVRVRARAGYVDLYGLSAPHAICVRPGLTTQETAFALIHELTHYLERENLEPAHDLVEDLDEAHPEASEEKYARRVILQRGEEVEAHKNGYGAMLRAGLAIPEDVAPFFDSRGNLVDEKEFAARLLEKHGYRVQYINEFRERLVSELKHTQSILSQLQSLPPASSSEARKTQIGAEIRRHQERLGVLRRIYDSYPKP